MTELSDSNEVLYTVLKTTIYKAPIQAAAVTSDSQSSQVPYPHHLNLSVMVEATLPLNVPIEECEVLPAPDHMVQLGVQIKHARVLLKPYEGLVTPLMTVLISVLSKYGRDGRACFEKVEEQVCKPGSKDYSSVGLQISPLDEPTRRRFASGKPIAYLKRAQILITFSGSSLSNLETHLATSPLGRPLAVSLQRVTEQMLARGFLKHWPFVFNRIWREGWPIQDSISNSLHQLASRSRNPTLLARLHDLRETSDTRPLVEVLSQKLFDLHKSLEKPIIIIPQARRSPELDFSDLEENDEPDGKSEKPMQIKVENTHDDNVLELDSEIEEILDCNSQGSLSICSMGSSSLSLLDQHCSDNGSDDSLLG
ncbi:uncharacterized protein MELLADRAFT_106608 [Melampsora larici-populina 98AG31]|uniref:Uncharacterized protein n=1 Tax=Melampsora larici-populina (strain 98AG31 / pathotype 3-4-7) TaxID=747676 RepID=F4RM22_MELLP|nr:uncharacterized protein MELLADRAFT_106608 [Melampsora larici-populina 98AG31]EGG06662.1 hypothetical protein MELLADRAFT_106608 [Melampsora larici-populina 98AG31]